MPKKKQPSSTIFTPALREYLSTEDMLSGSRIGLNFFASPEEKEKLSQQHFQKTRELLRLALAQYQAGRSSAKKQTRSINDIRADGVARGVAEVCLILGCEKTWFYEHKKEIPLKPKTGKKIEAEVAALDKFRESLAQKG